MTTTLLAPQEARAARAQEARAARAHEERAHDTRAAANPQAPWTFQVEGMPGRVRGDVEKIMLLLPEGTAGEQWFTRWRKHPDGWACREPIPAGDTAEFEAAITKLAREHGFSAWVNRYAGAYV